MTLGLPDTSLIQVQSVDTSVVPNGGTTGGSVTSGANCWGIQIACNELKKRLVPVASMLETAAGAGAVSWQDKVTAAMTAGLNLSVQSWDAGLTVSGNCYAATVAVVELDVLTGETQILRADLLYDCGKSLSPEIDLGQTEGAFMIGVGHFMTEGLECERRVLCLLLTPVVSLTGSSVLRRRRGDRRAYNLRHLGVQAAPGDGHPDPVEHNLPG